MNTFAEVFRKQRNQKHQNPKKRSVNNVDEEPHPEDSVNVLQLSKLYESDYGSGDDNMVATIHNDLAKIEPLNMPIKIGIFSTALLVDAGSACSLLNHKLATRLVNGNSHAIWVRGIVKPELQIFSNELIQIEGKIQTPVTSSRWHTPAATFTVITDGLKPLIGRDMFDMLGHAVTQ